jgi:hypothetical protein
MLNCNFAKTVLGLVPRPVVALIYFVLFAEQSDAVNHFKIVEVLKIY